MRERWSHWIESAGGISVLWRRALVLAGATVMWFHPSSGVTEAMLWIAGLYALWNWRKTLTAWKNPAGAFFGLGALWALASVTWSFYPAGTARDLLKNAPLVLGVLAVPVIFDRRDRIWAALVVSAAMITMRMAVELVRLVVALGWPKVLTEARFYHPYLYTHPNVSSMMAGLCVLVFVARGLAGAPGRGRSLLLAAGIGVDLAFMVMMASRGPQVVFAVVALAAPIVLLPGWRARLVAAVLAVALAFALWEVVPKVNPRFYDHTMPNFNQRGTIWFHAKKMLGDRRPMLGYGFGKRAFEKAVYENPEQRAPLVHYHYPHAHSYWLMLYFQGGRIGFALWSLGWLALGIRLCLFARRAEQATIGWREKVHVRALPALLGTGIAFILIYGIGDFPDHVIRATQFYLIGLVVALTLPPPKQEDGAT